MLAADGEEEDDTDAAAIDEAAPDADSTPPPHQKHPVPYRSVHALCDPPTHVGLCLSADGEEEDDTDAAAGDEAADADAPADAAAAAGQADGDAAAAASAQQLGRSDSGADSSVYWSGLLKPRWEVLRRDELEALEQHQVGDRVWQYDVVPPPPDTSWWFFE